MLLKNNSVVNEKVRSPSRGAYEIFVRVVTNRATTVVTNEFIIIAWCPRRLFVVYGSPTENRTTVGNDRDVDTVEGVLLDREQRRQTVHQSNRKHLHRVGVRYRTKPPQKYNAPILRRVNKKKKTKRKSGHKTDYVLRRLIIS